MCPSNEGDDKIDLDAARRLNICDPILAELIAIGEQQIQSNNTVLHEDAEKRLSRWID